jgi:Uma2 family endonuclease
MSTATIPSTVAAGDVQASVATSILFQNELEVPLGIASLEDFRAWARSDGFPERGRIDYIDGRIEVDLMVENIFYHAFPKSEIARVILARTHSDQSGDVAIDRCRVSNSAAGLSSEPDLVFVSDAGFTSGRVKFTPARSDDPDSFIEIEGSPDWVCEIVSDGSEQKDTVRLAKAYFAAGVTEYWLVDARGESLDFAILQRGQTQFESTLLDDEGYCTSGIFRHRYRLSRERSPIGHWRYTLDEKTLI